MVVGADSPVLEDQPLAGAEDRAGRVGQQLDDARGSSVDPRGSEPGDELRETLFGRPGHPLGGSVTDDELLAAVAAWNAGRRARWAPVQRLTGAAYQAAFSEYMTEK